MKSIIFRNKSNQERRIIFTLLAVIMSVTVSLGCQTLANFNSEPTATISPTDTPLPTFTNTITPTSAPTATLTPTQTTAPTNTSAPTNTLVPNTPTPAPFVINDETFDAINEIDCSTEVEIIGIQGADYSLMVEGFSLTVNREGWENAVLCLNSKHTWIGTLTYEGFTFASDEDDPLQFVLISDQEYLYIQGEGTVTFPDGSSYTLGDGQDPDISSPQGEFNDWPIFLLDEFDSDANGWLTGDENYSGQIGNFQISNGVYQWSITSLDSFAGYYQLPIEFPNIENLTDFYVSVEADYVSGVDIYAYGINFRIDSNWNYYSFGICPTCTEFIVQRRFNGETTVLIDWTSNSAIRTNGVNQLAVLAEGSNLQFFINGELVGEVEDDVIGSGMVGINGAVYETDDQVSLEFDNFEVRVPQE
ncbi:MAG: hypothetical protein FVQ83_10300 [Chloroflexi bacterium]|nr:hypothetical protein [Chloroflexota bacterium]